MIKRMDNTPKIKPKFLQMAKERTDLNQHADHLASCLCCTHLHTSDGDNGYSEVTPGWEATIECNANVVNFDSKEYLVRTLAFFHEWGPYCPAFNPKSEHEYGGVVDL